MLRHYFTVFEEITLKIFNMYFLPLNITKCQELLPLQKYTHPHVGNIYDTELKVNMWVALPDLMSVPHDMKFHQVVFEIIETIALFTHMETF